ncbi:nitroreductase [Desulfobacula sp.]|uniref:nitroreductase n=1 Tax=Desulfobacula sp. TaxID=2593537 RepID=UPI002637C72A|nr:nitroreductase [Desulfobacula sp.]
MDVTQAMKQRKSIRNYLDKPVSRSDIEAVIRCAGLAPSAINLQPWEYVVTYGEEKDRLIRRLKKVHAMKAASCGPGTAEPLPEKVTNRSRNALKIMKPQIEKLNLPFNQFIEQGSCSFYGAPVGIIVLMDKLFPKLRYLDIGLSVSYLLLAAEEKGLSTCPIGLITEYGDDIKDVLNISEEKDVLLAIALGYADETAPENDVKPDREPLKEILTWYE